MGRVVTPAPKPGAAARLWNDSTQYKHEENLEMASNVSNAVIAAASTGLMLGALSGCGGYQAGGGDAASPAEAAAEAKACCKGMNECKGKGNCAVEGKNGCAGKNECKGQGGCNAHCPK
jgi:hypothetical protein